MTDSIPWLHSGHHILNVKNSEHTPQKEYFTLNVSNIVLVILKSFITFCWGKKRIKKKSHIKSQSQYFGKKSQLDYFPKSFSPSNYHPQEDLTQNQDITKVA